MHSQVEALRRGAHLHGRLRQRTLLEPVQLRRALESVLLLQRLLRRLLLVHLLVVLVVLLLHHCLLRHAKHAGERSPARLCGYR